MTAWLQAATLHDSMNRSTREGKRAAVNVCIYTATERITVNQDKLAH